MTVRKWPVVGLLLAVLWLFVRGVALTPSAVLGEFLIGLAVGLPIAFVTRRLYLDRVAPARDLRALPTAALYLATVLREVLTANLDVAYRVLHPSMPIEPDVVEIPLRVSTDAAVTTIANSITLTPGTLTMDHDEETNTLYVHGIIGRRREAVVAPIRRWEDLLLVVFDEEARPGDPAPTPAGDGRRPAGPGGDAAGGAGNGGSTSEPGSDAADVDGSADRASDGGTSGAGGGGDGR